MRFQLSLDKDGERDLQTLKRTLHIDKTARIYDLALGLLLWAVEGRLQGFEIARYDDNARTARLLSLRELDRIGCGPSGNGSTADPAGDSTPEGAAAGKAGRGHL